MQRARTTTTESVTSTGLERTVASTKVHAALSALAVLVPLKETANTAFRTQHEMKQETVSVITTGREKIAACFLGFAIPNAQVSVLVQLRVTVLNVWIMPRLISTVIVFVINFGQGRPVRFM